MLVSLTAVVFAVLVGSGDALKWNQCGSKNSVVVNDLDMTPSPLKMPGKSHLTLDLSFLKQLNGSDAQITIKKSTWLGWFKIPCLFEVGSCTYKDTCSLMHRMMDENWGGFLGPIVTQMWAAFGKVGAKMDCPVPVQKFRLDKVELSLPKVPFYMKFLTKGDYKIKIDTHDMRTKEPILCLEWEMTVA